MKKDNISLSPIPPVESSIMTLSDAYKYTHHLQRPNGTQRIYSYLESRGGDVDYTVFFGLQYVLKKYLTGKVVFQEHLDYAEDLINSTFGYKYFNRKDWEYIIHEHDGRLPVMIKAVPEGTKVPLKNVLMTIVNTDERLSWLTNYLETLIFESVWYGTTVATISNHIKNDIEKYAQKAGEHVNPFHLNDFGFRGASSVESAGLGGAAHLISFLGTDTIQGIKIAKEYYDAPHCGYSVYAAEHSTVTPYGKDREEEAYANLIDNAPDDAIISIVVDSYDTENAVDKILGERLKEKILARKGKLVVRPDSGYPPEIALMILKSLWKNFGGTVNESGYKVLNPKVGVIYGDGIERASIERILFNVTTNGGFAPSNIIFGMGGALLQKVNRDTFNFAIKCSAAKINDEWIDVYKDPVTQSNKASKRGILKLVRDEQNTLVTTSIHDIREDVLVPVFNNGEMLTYYTFDQVKANANS